MGQISTTPEKAIHAAEESGDVYPPTDTKTPSKFKLPNNASTLSKAELVNRIRGTIYGNCIGDAIGLATEFMSKVEAKRHYSELVQKTGFFSYDMFVRDAHRSRWAKGDWTDDSDQMLLILDGAFYHSGDIIATDFAQRLKFWTRHGFPEVGDLAGLGIGATVNAVVNSPEFKTNPHKCAHSVWDRSNRVLAANGAVMRTSILGVLNFDDINKVISNTKTICLTTHADPRCIASCVAVTTAISLMLQKGIPDKGVQEVIKQALEYGRKELDPKATDEKSIAEFDKHGLAPSLDALDLDDDKKIGYTYKCYGSAFYCLANGTDFKKSITELTFHAGDSDTNGAVAGALLGCKLGYDALPKDWLEGLKNKKWLDLRVNRLLFFLGLIDEAEYLHSKEVYEEHFKQIYRGNVSHQLEEEEEEEEEEVEGHQGGATKTL